MTIRRADVFSFSVTLSVLLAQFIIHCQGQVVYLFKLAYTLLYKHTNAAHILKDATLLLFGTIEVSL